MNDEMRSAYPVVNAHNEWDPLMPDSHPMYTCSKWLNMNVLMLDEERVIISKGEDTLIKALRDWGFNPIPCRFYNFATIAGGFHCAAVDIRRRGDLKSDM
jgi:glycine amidinotransferase